LQKVLVALTLVALSARPVFAQTKDPRTIVETAMMQADRLFNQAAADRDMKRFLTFVADDAKFDAAEGLGKDAVAKAWAPFFEPDGPTISWAPTKAEALVATDVGYTVGTWERHSKSAAGIAVVTRGEYLTVWRKQKDGIWRVEFDTGSTRPQVHTLPLR
jgi:ketosteroid isomerase-like protein